jgi:hypothetical protein
MSRLDGTDYVDNYAQPSKLSFIQPAHHKQASNHDGETITKKICESDTDKRIAA